LHDVGGNSGIPQVSEHLAKINAYFLANPPHSIPIRERFPGNFANPFAQADSTASNRKKRPYFQ